MIPTRAQWLAAYEAIAKLGKAGCRICVCFGQTPDKEPIVVTWYKPPLGGARHVKGDDLTKVAAKAAEMEGGNG